MPFPYFGRKARIAHLYPRPRYDTIVEPFAGSAGYSLHADHWMRQVVLCEVDPGIAGLWRWLIDPATTPEVIAGLPDLQVGAQLADLAEGPALKLLQLTAASADHGKLVASAWMARDWPQLRARVARQVPKVKHWQLVEGDYSLAPDVAATWFVDPPYQLVAHGYGRTRDTLDYEQLGAWCRARAGQVMVCEEGAAAWLPFEPLTARTTLDNTATTEVWWTNEPPLRLWDAALEGATDGTD